MASSALRLSLVPPSADARRLRCLVVGHGTAFTTEVSAPDARVAALQQELAKRIAGAASPSQLALFLARDDATGGWPLRTGDDDTAMLALATNGEKDDGGHDGKDDKEDAASRLLSPQRRMDPNALLRAYVPEQPPLYGGQDELVHVLVRVELASTLAPGDGDTSDVAPTPTSLLEDDTVDMVDIEEEEEALPPHSLEQQQRGLAETLVASLCSATVETLRRGALWGDGLGAVLPPALVRCHEAHGALWLPDDIDEEDDRAWPSTSMYVPSAWRALAGEIFGWVVTAPTKRARFTGELRGRRALLTGAPRAGKSVFLAFLLLQLLRMRAPPVCVVDVPGVTFARVDAQRGHVDEGARDASFRDELSDERVVYLFDVSAVRSANGVTPLNARVVLARSILVRPHQRVPRTSKRTQSFVIPAWSRPDAEACARSCYPLLSGASVRTLFGKWGGLPGRLFARDPSRSIAALEAAIAELTPIGLVRGLARVARTGAWDGDGSGNGDEKAAVWRALVVPMGEENEGLSGAGRYAGGSAFTSQFVCDRLLAMAPLSTRTLRGLAATAPATLAAQMRVSLAFLAQEEEEKRADAVEGMETELVGRSSSGIGGGGPVGSAAPRQAWD